MRRLISLLIFLVLVFLFLYQPSDATPLHGPAPSPGSGGFPLVNNSF